MIYIEMKIKKIISNSCLMPPFYSRYLDLYTLASQSIQDVDEEDLYALQQVDVHRPETFPMEALLRATTLERSQAEALQAMLTRPVALSKDRLVRARYVGSCMRGLGRCATRKPFEISPTFAPNK